MKETAIEELHEIEPGYRGKEVACEYAGFQQRWLVVFSDAAQRRELKTLGKAQARELENALKEWRKLEERTFNCQADAEAALAQFNQKWKYHRASAQAQPLWQFPPSSQPLTEEQKEISAYLLQGQVAVDETALAADQSTLGRFIIATNELDAGRLSTQAMLENYKDQGVSVECGFRFLKDPLFFAHCLFLKKPHRLMALLMVMGLALLIYSLAEHKLRRLLQEKQATLPDQRRKPTAKPTIRWVFSCSTGWTSYSSVKAVKWYSGNCSI